MWKSWWWSLGASYSILYHSGSILIEEVHGEELVVEPGSVRGSVLIEDIHGEELVVVPACVL